MTETKSRWDEYYKTRKYRGFHKQREQKYRLSGFTILTFYNGDKLIHASGIFKEEALEKIFNKIDKYLCKKEKREKRSANEPCINYTA